MEPLRPKDEHGPERERGRGGKGGVGRAGGREGGRESPHRQILKQAKRKHVHSRAVEGGFRIFLFHTHPHLTSSHSLSYAPASDNTCQKKLKPSPG